MSCLPKGVKVAFYRGFKLGSWLNHRQATENDAARSSMRGFAVRRERNPSSSELHWQVVVVVCPGTTMVSELLLPLAKPEAGCQTAEHRESVIRGKARNKKRKRSRCFGISIISSGYVPVPSRVQYSRLVAPYEIREVGCMGA